MCVQTPGISVGVTEQSCDNVFLGKGKARNIILEYWDMILLLHVRACDLK